MRVHARERQELEDVNDALRKVRKLGGFPDCCICKTGLFKHLMNAMDPDCLEKNACVHVLIRPFKSQRWN